MKCEKELALLREDIRKGRKNKKLRKKSWQKCWRFLQRT